MTREPRCRVDHSSGVWRGSRTDGMRAFGGSVGIAIASSSGVHGYNITDIKKANIGQRHPFSLARQVICADGLRRPDQGARRAGEMETLMQAEQRSPRVCEAVLRNSLEEYPECKERCCVTRVNSTDQSRMRVPLVKKQSSRRSHSSVGARFRKRSHRRADEAEHRPPAATAGVAGGRSRRFGCR